MLIGPDGEEFELKTHDEAPLAAKGPLKESFQSDDEGEQ